MATKEQGWWTRELAEVVVQPLTPPQERRLREIAEQRAEAQQAEEKPRQGAPNLVGA
jgi:hypothetical protein